MPKFLAIHPVDLPVPQEAVIPLAKKCKAGVSLDVHIGLVVGYSSMTRVR
ncbi:MAG: hypothetical protein XU11_C0024G0033 [Candidatus Dadabacteria bacterium CSP1-2]|nr:MAG: hypothetical protein XU11_C0024G0033 [Candidatus Dadabacteria bacterium CSP1-2]